MLLCFTNETSDYADIFKYFSILFDLLCWKKENTLNCANHEHTFCSNSKMQAILQYIQLSVNFSRQSFIQLERTHPQSILGGEGFHRCRCWPQGSRTSQLYSYSRRQQALYEALCLVSGPQSRSSWHCRRCGLV